jgi:aminomethyltransferase
MLAIQGPHAIQKTLEILTPAEADAVSTLAAFECVDVDDCFFARTGYTGEAGLEIILPQDKILSYWQALQTKDITPCGLAARDTLRLEAGFLLYGQDMDETKTPLNSGLGWTVQWEPYERDFIGMDALLSQKKRGPKKKLVGLKLKSPGIMRPGQTVFLDGEPVGKITSGSYSPTLKHSIAIARVLVDVYNQATVEIRGQQEPVEIGKIRFLSN